MWRSTTNCCRHIGQPADHSSGRPCIAERVKVEGDFFHGHVPGDAVYVGRAAPGLPRSPYANPYPARVHGPEEAIRLYREHLAAHPELAEAARQDLAGHDLAPRALISSRMCTMPGRPATGRNSLGR